MEWIKNLLTFLVRIFTQQKPIVIVPPKPIVPNLPPLMTKREILFEAAQASLGKDITPFDEIPDELACVQQLCVIAKQVYPDFPSLISTIELSGYLRSSHHFAKTKIPKLGTIIVGITGTGDGTIKHGHCGIFLRDLRIASNSSLNGKWEDNYSLDSFLRRFRDMGKMTIEMYDPL